MKVIAIIKSPNGKIVEYKDEYEWENFEDADFQWFENNYSCDCNRALFVDEEAECSSENKYKVILIGENGETKQDWI